MSNNSADTTLFTYDRLSNFVKNYKGYVNNLINSKEGPDGDRYKYYNFQYSPNGIIMVDIGRIPSSILTLSKYANWTAPAAMNSPNAWKMNIGKTYNALKLQNQSTISNLNKTPGLQFTVITLPNNSYSLNLGTFQLNSIQFINAFQPNNAGSLGTPGLGLGTPGLGTPGQGSPGQGISTPGQGSTNVLTQGIASSLDNYANAFNDPNSRLPIMAIQQQATVIGCEWFGYFNPKNSTTGATNLGNYVFTINVGSGYFYAWIGDKAICEYTPQNADVFNGNQTATITINQTKYYPIRIQYYAQITDQTIANSTMSFSLTINQMNSDGSLSIVPTGQCLSILKNADGTLYYPPLQYLAFVSPSPDDFHLGQFKCYQLDLTTSSYSNLFAFYQLLNTYKFGMQTQKYDMAENVIGFGQLPDNTKYTPVNNDPNSLPYLYAIYRLDTDLRMGNSVQIDSTLSGDNLYPMRTIATTLLQPANTYYTLPQYYPPVQTTSTYNPATNLDGDACKLSCDQNPNCKHYFTYTSSGNAKCITDTTNSLPEFNQIAPSNTINPIDVGSSTLFLRNVQFQQPDCGELNNGQSDLVATIKTVNNTDTYNSSFPYSNYDWSSQPPITTINDIGICGDTQYKGMTNDAAQILFQNAEYNRNGTWTTTGPNGQTVESFQTTPPVQMKFTDVINDTNNSINANLQNERQYAQMMQQVNQNYVDLSQKDIPNYLAMRKIMNDNPNYDFNGNVLLNYRTKPIPTALQKSILDAKEEGNSQNQIYVLGTLTVATLLVLAIVIGRE